MTKKKKASPRGEGQKLQKSDRWSSLAAMGIKKIRCNCGVLDFRIHSEKQAPMLQENHHEYGGNDIALSLTRRGRMTKRL
jgi:hypothetical protein